MLLNIKNIDNQFFVNKLNVFVEFSEYLVLRLLIIECPNQI